MTHNQIDYYKIKSSEHIADAQLRESKRVADINKRLRENEMKLQRDLKAIDVKYKDKELSLNRDIAEKNYRINLSKLAQTETQLQMQQYANYTARLQANELARSNKANEVIKLNTLAETTRHSTVLENIENRESVAKVNSLNASANLTRAQSFTETKRPANVQSQTVSNYVNSISGLLNTVFNGVRTFTRGFSFAK